MERGGLGHGFPAFRWGFEPQGKTTDEHCQGSMDQVFHKVLFDYGQGNLSCIVENSEQSQIRCSPPSPMDHKAFIAVNE